MWFGGSSSSVAHVEGDLWHNRHEIAAEVNARMVADGQQFLAVLAPEPGEARYYGPRRPNTKLAVLFQAARFTCTMGRWRRLDAKSTSISILAPGWPFTRVTGFAQTEDRGQRSRGS